jgi:hypothetical protein
MDDTTRLRVAEALEKLAAQPVWNDDIWKLCFELVEANLDDELLAYVYDDLIHCSATPPINFRNPPKHPQFDDFKEEFRDVAKALRDRLSLVEARKKFGL